MTDNVAGVKHLYAATALILATTLTGCSSSSDSPKEDKPNVAKTTKAPKPKFDGAAYAKKLEHQYVAQLAGRKIKDGCDPAAGTWQCYFDSIEAKSQARIDIKMTTPGDVSKSAAKDFSKRARLAWFNFVGADNPKLDTIVTFVNGRDTGTTYRRDVPLLNR